MIKMKRHRFPSLSEEAQGVVENRVAPLGRSIEGERYAVRLVGGHAVLGKLASGVDTGVQNTNKNKAPNNFFIKTPQIF